VTPEELPGAVAGLALILARVSSALAVAPITGEWRGPRLVGISLAVGASLAIGLARPAPGPIASFPLAAAGETALGLLLGLSTRLALLPAELLGESAASEAGLTVAVSLDPAHAEPTAALQALIRSFALLLFAALGGLDALLLLLGRSFDLLPPGQAAAAVVSPGALALVPALVARAALAAVGLALPLLAASALATASLAILARALPRLNLISDAAPLRALTVVVALGVALPLVAPVVAGALDQLPGALGLAAGR